MGCIVIVCVNLSSFFGNIVCSNLGIFLVVFGIVECFLLVWIIPERVVQLQVPGLCLFRRDLCGRMVGEVFFSVVHLLGEDLINSHVYSYLLRLFLSGIIFYCLI